MHKPMKKVLLKRLWIWQELIVCFGLQKTFTHNFVKQNKKKAKMNPIVCTFALSRAGFIIRNIYNERLEHFR